MTTIEVTTDDLKMGDAIKRVLAPGVVLCIGLTLASVRLDARVMRFHKFDLPFSVQRVYTDARKGRKIEPFSFEIELPQWAIQEEQA